MHAWSFVAVGHWEKSDATMGNARNQISQEKSVGEGGLVSVRRH
jgi:hypothetical protein